MNLGLYVSAAGIVASLSLAFLWQSEKTENAELRGKLEVTEQQIITLKSSLEMMNSQAKQSLSLVGRNADILSSHDKVLAEERKTIERLENQLNSMRAKELQNAMQDPFGRGNNATERWDNVMQLISGKGSGEAEGSNDSGPPKSSNTGTTGGAKD